MTSEHPAGGSTFTRAPFWMFWLAVTAAGVVGAELGAIADVGPSLPSKVPGLALWTVVAASVAFLVVTGRREILRGRQTVGLIAQLKDALGSFGTLTETSLGALPLDALLHQLLGRLCSVLEADVATVLVTDDGVGYSVRASHGSVTGGDASLTGGPEDRAQRVISDASDLGRLSAAIGFAMASAACCPVLVEGRLIGLCIVGSSSIQTFAAPRLQLIQLVADRAGVDIERARLGEATARSDAEVAQADRHGAMLARASEVLLAATDDYHASLAALVDVVVPGFADRCAIDVVGAEVPCTSVGRHALTLPIAAGEVVFGTLCVERDPERPPYDPRDVAATVELAGRVAVSLERVLRYREAREAAESSRRMAGQLDQLVRTSIDVQPLREESEVLSRIAERARQVLGAQIAVVTAAGGEASVEAVARQGHDTILGRPTDLAVSGGDAPGWIDGRALGWLVKSFAGGPGERGGRVAVRRAEDDEFTADDETVLALLARMAVTALDNTRLYRTIQDREARWRVLVEAAPISIVEIDLDGAVVWWNRSATTLFAWPDRSADQPSASFAVETAAGLHRLWSELSRGGAVVDGELTGMSVGGDIRDLAVSAAPLRSAGGDIHSMLLLIADVTDRRRLEEELHRAQQTEAIGQLAGAVAHDFNNLLTMITGYIELWQRDLETDPRSTELVTSVQSAIGRASLLTGQLLTISRRQPSQPIVLAPVDVLRSVAEVVDRILGTTIELRWALDVDSGQVRIDPGELEQVILNLVINARDAMPHGGRLDIAVFPAELDRTQATILDLPPGRYVGVSVADSGTGMSPETLRRCFEPLFTTKGSSHGTGLGLAAVRGVVNDSGGAVHAWSIEGCGTTVAVHLPLVDRAASGPAAGLLPRGPETVRTVLVIEDDVSVRRLMGRVLSRAGYQVLEAAGGAEALEMAASWPGVIGVVITAVDLPDSRGPEIVATLSASRPSIRSLLVAGGTGDPDLRALPADPSAFLAKPFRPSELLERVAVVLATCGSPDPSPAAQSGPGTPAKKRSISLAGIGRPRR